MPSGGGASELDGHAYTHLIQILLPLRVKYFPQGEGTATDLIEAASEPLDGSVRQYAATVSPSSKKRNKKISVITQTKYQ